MPPPNTFNPFDTSQQDFAANIDKDRGPEPSGGLGILAFLKKFIQDNPKAAAAIGLAGLSGDFLGGLGITPSDQERQLLASGQRAVDAQTAGIEGRNQAFQSALRLLGQMSGQGRPPVFRFNLREPQDIGQFIEGIQPQGEFNALLRLLGGSGSLSTGAANQALAGGLGLQKSREDALAQLIGDLLFGGEGNG